MKIRVDVQEYNELKRKTQMSYMELFGRYVGIDDGRETGMSTRIAMLESMVAKLESDRDLLLDHLGLKIKTIERHDEIVKG